MKNILLPQMSILLQFGDKVWHFYALIFGERAFFPIILFPNILLYSTISYI